MSDEFISSQEGLQEGIQHALKQTPTLPDVVCTTPVKREETALHHGEEVAQWFRCRFVPRRRRSIRQLLAEEEARVVVVADVEPKLYHARQPETALFFHPGMAMQRIDHLVRGYGDRLITVAQVKNGDTILDATLGAGNDTLVLSHAVGESGRIVAVEGSPPLARLFQWAQRERFSPYAGVSHLASRIDVVEANYLQFLQSLADESVDVVYFDPMFQHAITNPSANMDAMRPFTLGESVSSLAMEHAKRVARRCVVVKERPRSGEFERLHMHPDKPRARIAYGVWYKERNRLHDGCQL